MKLERARAVVDFIVERAAARVSVFVADEHGELVAAATMDGAAPDTRRNAQRKAYAAARSDARSTAELAEKARADAAERAGYAACPSWLPVPLQVEHFSTKRSASAGAGT